MELGLGRVGLRNGIRVRVRVEFDLGLERVTVGVLVRES